MYNEKFWQYHIDTRKGVEIFKSHERFKRRRRSVYNYNMQIITSCNV